jgi:hypothetical protein
MMIVRFFIGGKKMKERLFPMVLAMAILLTGCSAGTNSQTISARTASDTTIMIASETAAVTTTNITVSTTNEPITTTAETTTVFIPVLPLLENTSGKVQIQTVAGGSSYKFNSYIITSAEGETIVVDPTAMPSIEIVDLKPAAIISTHMDPDHADSVYTDSYDCQKIISEKADITTRDFHIYSIPSSHLGDVISENASNYMVVIEVDGLRIAHLGDLGQKALTEDQLMQLGDIDIAFAQFGNIFSGMNLKNMKGYNLIEQLNPKIIIPTHYSDVNLPVFEEKYGPITAFEDVLTISKDDIPADNLHIYCISNGHVYSND